MLPPEVLDAAAEHILAKTKIRMRCWEKCLLCGEILARCGCNGRKEED